MLGEWLTSKIAGPAFESARLFGAPGVPRLAGMAIRPVASSQLPWTRSNTSGQPCSHRALNRSVAVWPAANVVLVRLPWTEFAPVQILSLHRRCSERLLR